MAGMLSQVEEEERSKGAFFEANNEGRKQASEAIRFCAQHITHPHCPQK